MAVEPQRLMTAQELAALPEVGMRHELIDGVLYTTPPAKNRHGFVAGSVFGHVLLFLDRDRTAVPYAAETGFRVKRNPDRVRAADVAVVRRERLPPEGYVEGYFEGAPDLVVEVVSPDDTGAYALRKVADWLEGGSQLVWAVYPVGPRMVIHGADGSVTVLGPDDEVDGGKVLPGFRMPLRRLLEPFPG